MSDRVVKVRLLAQVSEYEAGMLKAAQATRKVGSEAEKLEQKRQAFDSFGRGLMVTGAALAGVTVLSVKAAMDWQSAWAGVTKTVDGTPEQLARVEEGLRGLTSVLPASHEEIAAVAEAAGQLGIKTGNVVAFTKTMIDLGETTNLSANEAATSLARFVNIMGTSQSKVSNLGSALVGLGNNYATTEREIMEMSMRLAGAGKQIGLSEGQVLGLSTALSSVGIEAEAGGSAMSKVMIDIAANVESGGAKLEKFADAAGMSAQQFADQWRSDPAAALAAFVKGLSNAESQGKSTLGILADLGITEVRMRDALLRSSAAADQFADAMAMGNSEFAKNNALTDEAAKRYETVESKLRIAGNAIRDAAIDFGEVFLPAVSGAAEGIAEFANFMGGLPDPVQGVVGVLTGATGAIALAGGAALLAVPKFAAFKIGLEVLTGTAFSFKGGLQSVVRFMTGPWGVALVASAALMATYNRIVEEGIPSQAEIANKIATTADATEKLSSAIATTPKLTTFLPSLDENTKAMLDDLPALLDQAAEAQDNWFVGLMKSSTASDHAFDALKRYGEALGTLAVTDMPAAQTGFTELVNAYELTDDQAQVLLDKMPMLKDAFTDLAREQGIAVDSSEFMEMVLGRLPQPMDDTAAALAEMQQEADEAARSLDDTAQALVMIANSALAMGDAKDRALSSVNSLTEAAKAEGAALDGTNDASIRLRNALREVEGAHRTSAEAIINNGGTLEQATAEWEKGRQKVIEMRVAKGEDIATANAWADENLGSAAEVKSALGDVRQAWLDLPENRKTKYDVEKAEAERRLAALKKSIEGIPTYKSITLETITLSNNRVLSAPGSENARGGYYSGGVKEFAAGGFEPGIYAHQRGGVHKFAEEYAEAYISMDPARRQRSQQVYTQVGRRMGFTSDGSDSAAVVAAIEQLRAELGRPNLSYTAVNPVHTDPLSDAWERSMDAPSGIS